MLRIGLAQTMKLSLLFTCLILSISANLGDIDGKDDPDSRDSREADSTLEMDLDSRELPKLHISVSDDPYIIRTGSSFSSNCYVDDYRTKVWWTKDERNISNYRASFGQIVASETLEITLAMSKDTGNYTCVARTVEGVVLSKTIAVRVVVSGDIYSPQREVRVENNNPVTLWCRVQGNPLSKFSWQYKFNPWSFGVVENNDLENATEISYASDGSVNMTLHFESVTVAEHGHYWCIAHDYRGPIVHHIFLNSVDGPSNFIDKHGLLIRRIIVLGKNSVVVRWKILLPKKRGNKFTVHLQYAKKGAEYWNNHTTTIGTNNDQRIVDGLEKNTTYQFRVFAIDSSGVPLTPQYSEWITTMEEDLNFTSLLQIEATTEIAIWIRGSVLPVEMEDQVRYYEVVLTHSNGTRKSIVWDSNLPRPPVFKNLEPMTSYRIKIAGCLDYDGPCGGWSPEQEVVTIDRAIRFIPNISVTRTTSDSISIGWLGPGPKLQDRVHQYQVIATHGDETMGPVWLNKTAKSYVFQNLTSGTSYKLKVAACSDLKTQCSYWSKEQEGLTIDQVKQGQGTIWLALSTIASISILVVVVVIWLVIRDRREKAARRRFIEATLECFNLGALDSLNPELNIGDQAELLPYNKKWEFPRELLTLDKILGSGAFGVVRKALAKSICRPEIVTTVAVKLVRASARLHHMTALTRELKILAHLGKHLNVVNLLGACTQNVQYGELLVIVEFCRFGNLRDYLLNRRDYFVDEVNVTDTSGNIDSSSSSSMDPATPDDNGVVTPGCGEDSSSTENSLQTTDFGNTSIKLDDDAAGSDTVEPDPPSKYQGDYTDDNLEPICTRDLLCWSWQISRGMEYLGSRRILHGDLAARNILLADRNVVKICDFGLAKALYQDDNYTKKGNGPLPVKWMAIESLRDKVFSIQSDIWSYGIVLWELFTLSHTPYPGINHQSVYQKLAEGFRLPKPKYATKDIYHMMLRCWDAEPKQRPSFTQIENILIDLLDERVKSHYLDLSAPYVQMNDDDLEQGEKDYLKMGPSDDTSNATEQVSE